MQNIIILFLLFTFSIFSCKKNSDESNRSSSNSSTGNFMISVTIDGVTHKAEGSVSTDIYSGGGASNNGNFCYKSSPSTVFAGLNDKSATSYVSGEVFSFLISFQNLSLGSSTGQISAFNTANIIFANGVNPALGFCSSVDTTVTSISSLELDFNITSLGSIGSINATNPNNYYVYGNPLEGNFSGTIFGTDGTYASSNISAGYVYNIPIQIEIDFTAVRSQF